MTDWTPAFEGQRPPMLRANQLAVKHGAFSARIVEPRAQKLVDHLRDVDPYWLEQVDAAAVTAWATAEARCDLLREWLAARPVLDPKGKPWPAADELLRWERRAADARSRLGFDPLSRARLGADKAQAHVALTRLGEEGRALVERHAPRVVDGEAS